MLPPRFHGPEPPLHGTRCGPGARRVGGSPRSPAAPSAQGAGMAWIGGGGGGEKEGEGVFYLFVLYLLPPPPPPPNYRRRSAAARPFFPPLHSATGSARVRLTAPPTNGNPPSPPRAPPQSPSSAVSLETREEAGPFPRQPRGEAIRLARAAGREVALKTEVRRADRK